MDKIIFPSKVRGVLTAPASKSYAQRAIAAALLCEGESVIENLTLCDDTSAALDTAQRLGAKVSQCDRTYTILGGLNPTTSEINIGESGLSTRLFTPVASLLNDEMTITGHGSILKRPIDMMVEPLRGLGVEVSTNGFLPVKVKGSLKGGDIHIDGSLSSQFLTGLLMSLPLAQDDSILRVDNLKSIPYIDMTLEITRDFGIEITHNEYREFHIKGGQRYTPKIYNVEGDWSGASCLMVAGAVAGGVVIRNLNPCSRQADLAMMVALERAGANMLAGGTTYTIAGGDLVGFDFDATHSPDLFPALAALAANCKGTTRLKGTVRLTNKESDRAQTIAEVFGRLGIKVDISQSDLMIIEGGAIKGGKVSSHNDHRIAMAAAVAALTADGAVEISQAESVTKSYPAFWDDLHSITQE